MSKKTLHSYAFVIASALTPLSSLYATDNIDMSLKRPAIIRAQQGEACRNSLFHDSFMKDKKLIDLQNTADIKGEYPFSHIVATKIPTEIQVTIFRYLPIKFLKDLKLVCKYFANFINNNNYDYIDTISVPTTQNVTNNVLLDFVSRFPNSKTLCLKYNHDITPEIIPSLPNIKNLDLGQNENFSDEHMEMLSNLTSLNLGDCSENITDNGIIKLTNLTDLTIGHRSHNITNAGIMNMGSLKKLTIKCSNNCNIDEHGITSLTNLEELCILGLKRINTFSGFVHMKSLRILHLENRYHIDKPEYDQFKLANPHVKIKWSYKGGGDTTWPFR